jgi:hypothetical protein
MSETPPDLIDRDGHIAKWGTDKYGTEGYLYHPDGLARTHEALEQSYSPVVEVGKQTPYSRLLIQLRNTLRDSYDDEIPLSREDLWMLLDNARHPGLTDSDEW